MKKKFNSESIRELRRLEGLSQNKLARILEVAPETIRNYENGRSTPTGFVVDFIWREYITKKNYKLNLFN